MAEAILPQEHLSMLSGQAPVVQAASPVPIPLCLLQPGQSADIARVDDSHPFAQRLRDLGFVPGTRLFVRLKAPFHGPIEYELRGSRFCLRPQDTQDIYVFPVLASR